MTGKTVTETGEVVEYGPSGTVVPADLAAVTEAAIGLLGLIPELPDSDGSGIIADLINAETWEDLNRGSHLPAGRDLAGVDLVVTDVHKRASDIEEDPDDYRVRLPEYLVIDGYEQQSRKPVRWQTSSPGLAVPIMKLYTWGKLPAYVTIVEAVSKSNPRFKPLNLTVRAVK